jgi:glycosyltransferase involved in cell wall biosynthesis
VGKIKEVTVFSDGDSSRLDTWSNVPYFFTETLMSKGIVVNRVNLRASRTLNRFFNRTFLRVLKWFKPESTYNYFRSLSHYLYLRRLIRKSIRQFPGSDAYIFLTFSFSSVGLTTKPTVLFCDWTYDHHLKYFSGRKPDFFERQSLRREEAQIENADLVISLFPKVTNDMKERYLNPRIVHCGNVINALHPVRGPEVIQLKSTSNSLLFIGSNKYIEGARTLIEAFIRLKTQHLGLVLHIVGMTEPELPSLPPDVHCHGYLDKGSAVESELYYELIREAKIFINTNPKWGAFSASVEAMYFHTPVVVAPYDDFIETFGQQIDFGRYCDENTAERVAACITDILTDTDYESLCRHAHRAVEAFTWSNYVDRVTALIANLPDQRGQPSP